MNIIRKYATLLNIIAKAVETEQCRTNFENVSVSTANLEYSLTDYDALKKLLEMSNVEDFSFNERNKTISFKYNHKEAKQRQVEQYANDLGVKVYFK